jgi:ankyrin repeat protein
VLAALLGNAEAIRTLCELGADANTRDKRGGTPVHAAAVKGHTKAIRALCQLGADINTADKDCVTPVHVAAEKFTSRLFIRSASWGRMSTPLTSVVALLCI